MSILIMFVYIPPRVNPGAVLGPLLEAIYAHENKDFAVFRMAGNVNPCTL